MSGNWTGLGASVRGVTHKRKGRPNQDSWGMWQGAEGELFLGVVADGHGSAQSARSHVGSALAVQVARQVVRHREESLYALTADEARDVAKAMARAIVQAWRAKVGEQLLLEPLRPHEFDALTDQERLSTVLDPARVYGSTLLFGLICPAVVIFIGIGDGEILWVSPSGEPKPVFPQDLRFIANETASLCSPAVADLVQVEVFERKTLDPDLVILCTDGVSNAFREEAGFLKLGSDLWADLRERSQEEIGQDLPDWLHAFSEEGSGDDATLCLLGNSRLYKRDGMNSAARAEVKQMAPMLVESGGGSSLPAPTGPSIHSQALPGRVQAAARHAQGFLSWMKSTFIIQSTDDGGRK